MHNDTIIHGATDAQKYVNTSRGNASAVGAKAKTRLFGALVAVVAVAVLVLAGCGDDAASVADTTVPKVSGVQFTATATTATITATVNEAGKLFWVAYTDGDAPADAAALIADAGKDKAAPIVANSGSAGQTVSAAGMVTVSITGLTASSNYDFYAVAQDAAGNNSALSAKLDINTFLPAVTDLSAVAAGGGTTDIVLSWTLPATIPSDAAKLQLRYATTRAGLADATPVDIATTRATILAATNYTLTATLTSGTEYYFAVLIVNSAGNALPLSGAGFTDDASYVTTGTPDSTLPGIPTGLSVTALAAASGGVSVTVAWQNPANAARIELSWTPATPAIGKETVDATASGSTQSTTITLADDTTYTISAVAINDSDARSSAARITGQRVDLAAPAIPTGVSLTPVADGSIAVSWTASASTDVAEYEVRWATTAGALPDSPLGMQTVAVSATSATTGVLTSGTTYYFVVLARDGANILGNKNTSSSVAMNAIARIIIDSDGDTLIDISNLDMLNNVRCNLAGTAYLTADSGGTCATSGGLQCGAAGATACTGYELMRNLDFATAGDYASGTVNNVWRPRNAIGTVISDTDSALNNGWVPIGLTFTGIFEGNGHAISNLYVRSSGNAGLFNTLTGTIRNLGVIDGAVYGTGIVGIVAALASLAPATITASYASGTANGGMGNGDKVGGLIGSNGGSDITASYASSTVNGGAGNDDQVGGLVGNNGGTITASYASGNADGGAGTGDKVGGLVGVHESGSNITASYASGNANGGAGASDVVGGLVGSTNGFSNIIASYASGGAKGGDDGSDTAGALIGSITGSSVDIVTSYGFGTAAAENFGSSGRTPKPASALVIAGTNAGCSDGTAANTASACTAGGAYQWVTWATAEGGAWNFGTVAQAPAVKYADYDGAGSGIDYCALFPANVPGTATPIVCGTTLLPGQGR